MDEAETILNAAIAVVAMRDKKLHGEPEEAESEPGESEETVAAESGQADEETDEEVEVQSAERKAMRTSSLPKINRPETRPNRVTTKLSKTRVPFIAEPEILAQDSADPVALTEAEPFTEDEIILQEPGRDLRPDTVVPSPEITSSDAAVLENFRELPTTSSWRTSLP